MIIVSLVFDFFVGFVLHKTRQWTMQFDGRIPDLARYTIGMSGFVFIAPVNVILTHRKDRHHVKFGTYENILIGLLITALAYGAGVVAGYILDTE